MNWNILITVVHLALLLQEILSAMPFEKNTNQFEFTLNSFGNVNTSFDYLFNLMETNVTKFIPGTFISNRTGYTSNTFVIGIPTVIRPERNYLIKTLTELLKRVRGLTWTEVLVIVYIGETQPERVESVVHSITKNFYKDIENGIIEIISPREIFYPNFDNLFQTLGDSKLRVHWRSKQNLDYVYLMLYAYNKGQYYLHLEDDVLPTHLNIVDDITRTIKVVQQIYTTWMVLDFANFGFAGKLFRTSSLPLLIDYLYIHFNDKPCDLLLEDYVVIHACRTLVMKKDKICQANKRRYMVDCGKMFVHIGKYSSLPGVIRPVANEPQSFFDYVQNYFREFGQHFFGMSSMN